MRSLVWRYQTLYTGWLTVDRLSLVYALCAPWARWAGYASSPLWYDEAYNVVITRLPLMQAVRFVAAWDWSPPGWQLLVWAWVRLAGENPAVVRLPSLLAGCGVMLVAWRLMDALDVHGWRRLVAVLLIYGMPGLLWAAQDARMYSLMALLYLAAWLWMLQGRYLAMGLALGCLCWLHYTGAIYAVVLGCVALAHDRRSLRGLVAGAVAAAPVVLVLTSAQTVPGGRSYRHTGMLVELVKSAWIAPHEQYGIIVASVLTLAGIGAGILAVLLAIYASRRSPMIQAAAITLAPVVIMGIIGAWANLATYRTLLPVVAPAVLWMCASIPRAPGRVLAGIMLALVITLPWRPLDHGGITLSEAMQMIQPGDRVAYSSILTALPIGLIRDGVLLHNTPVYRTLYPQMGPLQRQSWLIHSEFTSSYNMPGVQRLLDTCTLRWVVRYHQMGPVKFYFCP